nr:formin-like protein 5 [Lolium perenne]
MVHLPPPTPTQQGRGNLPLHRHGPEPPAEAVANSGRLPSAATPATSQIRACKPRLDPQKPRSGPRPLLRPPRRSPPGQPPRVAPSGGRPLLASDSSRPSLPAAATTTLGSRRRLRLAPTLHARAHSSGLPAGRHRGQPSAPSPSGGWPRSLGLLPAEPPRRRHDLLGLAPPPPASRRRSMPQLVAHLAEKLLLRTSTPRPCAAGAAGTRRRTHPPPAPPGDVPPPRVGDPSGAQLSPAAFDGRARPPPPAPAAAAARGGGKFGWFPT